MVKRMLNIISDNMFPQLRTWEQLLHDTNSIFHWDNLVKKDYQIKYEKALIHAKRKDFKKAGECFYDAAFLADKSHKDELKEFFLYCTWESAFWYGYAQPLIEFTQEIYEIHKNSFPDWIIEKLGICAIAYVVGANISRNKQETDKLYKLGGWLFRQYFDRTGEFKNYANEVAYYVFYGYACYKVGGKATLASFLYDLEKNVPQNYVRVVLQCLEEMKIR